MGENSDSETELSEDEQAGINDGDENVQEQDLFINQVDEQEGDRARRMRRFLHALGDEDQGRNAGQQNQGLPQGGTNALSLLTQLLNDPNGMTLMTQLTQLMNGTPGTTLTNVTPNLGAYPGASNAAAVDLSTPYGIKHYKEATKGLYGDASEGPFGLNPARILMLLAMV